MVSYIQAGCIIWLHVWHVTGPACLPASLQVAPGMILGKVFVLPGVRPYNPTDQIMDALYFALWQTCDGDGGYAHSADKRVVK